MGLGENIKKYRKAKKITQSELAELIEKSLRMVQKYEANDVTPSLEIIGHIAKALDVEKVGFISKFSRRENSKRI